MRTRHFKTVPVLLFILLLSAGCAGGPGRLDPEGIANSQFYDANGAFLPDRAKEAYVALMQRHGYPVYPGIREKMMVTDFGKGDFARLGFGVVTFLNDAEGGYSIMEVFLLPGQMLPEHRHEPTDKCPAKMGGWVVRYGLSHIVGEGEPNLGPDVRVPQSHMNGKTNAMRDTVCTAGETVKLGRPMERHWQYAGPEGAIVTEVATYHDPRGAIWSDEAINDFFRKK
ncbi:MAG TPA: hypothetical protein PL033_01790 [Candidatus Brocadiia bacterium]|nr:hypothetical protein [Candidatus Brocadiia bacterium]